MENKILSILRKINIATGICGLTVFIPGAFQFGIISILISITGSVITVGTSYLIEVKEAYTEPNKKIEIPQNMKCNGSNSANENMELQAIYSKTPNELGLEKDSENNDNTIISLGSASVENIINDTTPFPDKILHPVGFEISKTQTTELQFEKVDYQSLLYKDEDGNIIDNSVIPLSSVKESVKTFTKIRKK